MRVIGKKGGEGREVGVTKGGDSMGEGKDMKGKKGEGRGQ